MYLQCGADTMKPFMKIYLTFEKKEYRAEDRLK